MEISRVSELQEAINKFTEEMGRKPDILRIREDIVNEMANELELKFCNSEVDPTKKASERYGSFDGIPFIANDGFPHGIIRWRIEAVINGELVYHAKLDSASILKETIVIDSVSLIDIDEDK